MQSNTISLIDALRANNTSAANEAFARTMAEKVNAALDQEKVAVASRIYPVQTEAVGGYFTKKPERTQ